MIRERKPRIPAETSLRQRFLRLSRACLGKYSGGGGGASAWVKKGQK
eukprot:COSAG06_NODE_23233_length_698_cov_24.467446_1_plen_46_part_10